MALGCTTAPSLGSHRQLTPTTARLREQDEALDFPNGDAVAGVVVTEFGDAELVGLPEFDRRFSLLCGLVGAFRRLLDERRLTAYASARPTARAARRGAPEWFHDSGCRRTINTFQSPATALTVRGGPEFRRRSPGPRPWSPTLSGARPRVT